MPTILDLFKQANGNKDVTTWNGEPQDKGLGGKIMDFVKAEINPKGPRIMFYKKLVTPPLIYGSETPRISLKGTVDPPRSLSVASAKYNDDPTKKTPLSLGSLLGGSANRPSDTIFDTKTGKSVAKGTLPASVGDHSAIRYAVEAGVDYNISKVPMGPNALQGVLKGDLNQMAGKAIGAGIGAAKKAIGKAVTGLVTKKRKKTQKTKPPTKIGIPGKLYGGGTKTGNGDTKKGHVKNSEYFTSYTLTQNEFTNREEWVADGVLDRAKEGFIDIDTFNQGILEAGFIKNDADLVKVADSRVNGASFIKIKPYGTNHSLLFPATVTGISESVTPEWNSFKYVGSPYNTYRYGGVERTLSFEFKLYYLDDTTKQTMLRNLNSLKELAFPYNQPSSIKYSDKEVALGFAPNLIELSINGLYNNIFGFITTLEFSIDDATSWAATEWFGNETENKLYPTVINVSFGMTIIENHQLVKGKVTNTIRYNFDGLGISTTEYIEKEEQDKAVAAVIGAITGIRL
jgi:hypothetical protein